MTVEKKQVSLSQNNRITRNEHKSQLGFLFWLPVIEDNETYPPAKKKKKRKLQ